MKVFILTGWHDYEGSTFLGVFTTKKKAEANKNGRYDWFEINQWHIDGKEVKKRVKKLSKEEREQRMKRFVELNAPYFKAINEQTAKVLSPEYQESFRSLLLRTAMPNSEQNDERSVARDDDSSTKADYINNNEYERGGE